MDDIVTRLREQIPVPLEFADEGSVARLISKAADEIERLRKLVEHLSAQLRLQMKANDKAWEAYKEVVGDD